MEKLSFITLMCTLIVLVLISCSQSHEEHVKPIIKNILQTKAAIDNYVNSNKETKILYLSVWDFDGTIVKGDCSASRQ